MMLVYDVWINEVYVGRFAQEWGAPATQIERRRNIRFALVTDASGKLLQI